MILKNIDFGDVFVASGVLNFFGQGWPFHKFLKFLPGFNFKSATFVAKTTTLNSRPGNMLLDGSQQPQELFPKCIRVYPFKGVVLNSVGLSGPGAEVLLRLGEWQKRKEPFIISFMAVNKTKEERLEEMKGFVNLLQAALPDFKAPVGLEINISCPNTEHDPKKLVSEAIDFLTIASDLGVPLILKVNALVSVEAIRGIIDSWLCDAISCSNTIPWGELPGIINWQKFFGSEKSPLDHLGGGGLSGRPLLPIVADWINRVRRAGISIPIIGGGGILCKKDVDVLAETGVNAVALGSVAILRPWRVQGVIKHANKILG